MNKLRFIVIFLLVIWLIGYGVANLIGDTDNGGVVNNIALIPIKGTITADDGSQGTLFSSGGSSSSVIVDFIQRANEDDNIKGIILEINSPGGTVVASKEIADAVKNSNKPVVAWIREVGASGAYWVASASDIIVADPLSITGSIGVIGSYLEFSGLMEDYGVGYEDLKAGEYKDAGTPFKKLTNDEKDLLQSKLDTVHEYFIDEVAANRRLGVKDVRQVANGMFYLGGEAKQLGLVDVLGGRAEVDSAIMRLTNVKEVKIVSFQRKTSVLDILGRVTNENSYLVGKGIGDSLKIQNNPQYELIA